MLKDEFIKTCKVNRFAKNTIEGYWGWIKDFIIYNKKTHPSELGQKEIKKNVKAHTFRHSFATHLLEDGFSIKYIQELLGHNSIKTTEIYLQTTQKSEQTYKSPLDKLNRTEPKIYRITG